MAVEFEVVCGPKFVTFWDDVGDPLQLSTYLTAIVFHSEVGTKRWFLAPDLQGVIPQILDMDFQITLTSDRVVEYGLVPFSKLGDQLTKKERKKKNPGKI